jgi:hypothetical protein
MPHRSAAWAWLILFVLAAPLAHAQALHQFDLPEQPLADSLRAIASIIDSPAIATLEVSGLYHTGR